MKVRVQRSRLTDNARFGLVCHVNTSDAALPRYESNGFDRLSPPLFEQKIRRRPCLVVDCVQNLERFLKNAVVLQS